MTRTDAEAIEGAVQDFLEAIKADDVDRMMRFYAADAVLMPPDQAARAGAEAIRGWFEGVLAQFAVEDFISSPQELELAGDWGYRRGRFTWFLSPRQGGPTVERPSKFLQIWRRQPDGTWRVARGIWNADPSPPVS